MPVIEAQREWQSVLERNPVRFFMRQLGPLLDEARTRVAAFVGAPEGSLVFVRNATEGANASLKSIVLSPGDEVVTTNHDYNAIRNILSYICDRAGAKLVVAAFPFPLASQDEVVSAVAGALTPRTRLLVLDHVTSPTGLVLPIEPIVAEARARNIVTFVDGAHAPGMIPLDLRSLGADFYTGNLHKWVCAPKGAAFLYVRDDRREQVLPSVISHGYNMARPERRYLDNFEWQGTFDPSAWLSVPCAIDTMASLHPDGWVGVMRENRALALRARDMLAAALGIEVPAPDAMIGSLAALPLPDGKVGSLPNEDEAQLALANAHRIEVPIALWPKSPSRVLRISAQLYNAAEDYERLAHALAQVLH